VSSESEQARRRAHEVFDPIAEGYLTREGVDMGRMFSTEGLRVRGKVFACVTSRGELMLKLPAARIDGLVAAGTAERVVMRERAMREWVAVDVAHATDWAPLVGEAFAFLDEITP